MFARVAYGGGDAVDTGGKGEDGGSLHCCGGWSRAEWMRLESWKWSGG